MGLELDAKNIIDGIDTSAWSEAQRSDLRALVEAEKQALQTIEAEMNPSIADVIAAKRRAVEQMQQDAADATALAASRRKYGEDRISTHRTKLGLVIMIESPTFRRDDKELRDRYQALKDAGREDEAEFVWNEQMRRACVHPSQERLKEMSDRFPRFDEQLTIMYGQLATGSDTRFLGK